MAIVRATAHGAQRCTATTAATVLFVLVVVVVVNAAHRAVSRTGAASAAWWWPKGSTDRRGPRVPFARVEPSRVLRLGYTVDVLAPVFVSVGRSVLLLSCSLSRLLGSRPRPFMSSSSKVQ